MALSTCIGPPQGVSSGRQPPTDRRILEERKAGLYEWDLLHGGYTLVLKQFRRRLPSPRRARCCPAAPT